MEASVDLLMVMIHAWQVVAMVMLDVAELDVAHHQHCL
jgi:hypothetical protein